MADERRLAICIKGGVSLGAYEAGVLAKTLELIANNNSRPNAIPWYIDAMAGASAGSMTAVATACTLLNSRSDYLYDMWVSGAKLSALAPDSLTGVDDGYKNHDNLLAASSLDVLAKGFDAPPLVVSNRHAALRRGSAVVRMIFTLSNVNGVIQPIDTLNPTPLTFRDYADSARCDLSVDDQGKLYVSAPDTRAAQTVTANDDSSTAWHAMVQSSIASGSFPLAFAPRGLWRWHPERKEYTAEYYSDGGLFDNDPVGKLIDLAHEIDWAPANAAYQDHQRRFLIVHTAPTDTSPNSIRAPYPTLDLGPIELAQKIIPALLNESMESGLRGITAVNQRFQQRITVLNRFAKVAATSVAASTGPLESAISALAALRGFGDAQIQTFRGFLIPDLKDADPTLHDYVVKLPAPAQATFLDLAILFDLSFGMLDKVTVKPIVVAPAPGESLAGDPLFEFAGFLSQRLREFDFARGQYDAFIAWQAISARPEKDFSIEGAEVPQPVVLPEPDTNAPSSSNEYQRGLATFRDRVRGVVNRAIDELKADETGPFAQIGLDILQVIANLGVGAIS